MVLTLSKLILVFLAVTMVTATYIDVEREWREWKQRYNKVYSNQTEETERRHAWERAFRYVRNHGNRPGDQSFTVGMNSLADMLPRDYKLDVKASTQRWSNSLPNNNLADVPKSFDWRIRGVIPPVSNQGLLGSSLIDATEILESANAIRTGSLVKLSEQEVIDCCGGSIQTEANVFICLHKIGGVCAEAAYPKHNGTGSCKNDSCTPVVKVKWGGYIPTGREDLLLQHLLDQPILAMIDASHPSFQMYRSGIYFEKECSFIKLDHAVQVIGYGVQNGNDFWIVKNTWGTEWGMNGYILMSRNKNNQCGIATGASYPILE